MPAPAIDANRLRAELLAATRAAGTKHLAAAWRRLAGEEPMSAGADEVTRLESALHRLDPECNEKGHPFRAASVRARD